MLNVWYGYGKDEDANHVLSRIQNDNSMQVDGDEEEGLGDGGGMMIWADDDTPSHAEDEVRKKRTKVSSTTYPLPYPAGFPTNYPPSSHLHTPGAHTHTHTPAHITGAPALVPAQHVKIALSLYKVQQNIYLLDFQRVEVSPISIRHCMLTIIITIISCHPYYLRWP
ncbi:hypothetical protein EON65_21085 [archaeon]|nr:MAG: hypothetical protein EON65_21085 [archaeon]